MAAIHPAYNLMKMPGSSDVLTVAGDTKEALTALKLAFIIEVGLYIPMMGFLKCPRSSREIKLDAHPLSFLLSLHTLIALSAFVHGNPYFSR